MGNSKLVWIDLEMTGLDPDRDQIIEIATVVTESNLEIVANGPNIVIHCDLGRLEQMDEWNRTHHKKSNLWQHCIESEISVEAAERETIAFLEKHVSKGQSPLCGNSIWQDRRFLAKYMPLLNDFLHYRMVDVSTIKELVARWYPSMNKYQKSDQHRALDDIQESIHELQHYRKVCFKA